MGSEGSARNSLASARLPRLYANFLIFRLSQSDEAGVGGQWSLLYNPVVWDSWRAPLGLPYYPPASIYG